ncbi:uncharacterized protein LY89DRAFT_375144 [Mollisia scopiformis]|uniref:Protein kinase domain-containing protein n=1 Tax=Mollisia scopiformis TaxID=149040 RepID=A0A132B3V7_MOLSC|nr:uncharacterized protein LY89DRAFT_375144 [Mollisia scopiformis]KUJ07011.1 hypothetical protein LY89DRAFT_375144 [Mollisia scopiformis]
MSLSGQHAALHEFFRWESQSWVEVVKDITTDEKSYFMPLENLRTYFKANDSKKLNRILCEVFGTTFPPVDSDFILRDHTAVFVILLRIGQGKLIEHFAQYEELSDRRLPFDPVNPPRELLEITEDRDILGRFCEKQIMYCVPAFNGNMVNKNFGRRLLPITSKEPQGTEGLAGRYVIKVFGPLNKLVPAGQETTNNPNINTFVLKRYPTKEGEVDYTKEVNGFRSVKHADSIIKFYGSYILGNDRNILLEYADKGSLEHFFQKETPPSHGGEVIKFWEGLFGLIKGLKAIHSVAEGHHDVKPDTISVLSNGLDSADCLFKFSDIGLSARGKGNRQSTSNEMQAAPTYGAPECYMPYNSDDRAVKGPSKVTRAADIWSLGCVYSEAAIWLADGYKGLLDYRKQRKAETDRILFKGGECFHDGERTLQSVLDAHADIEDRLRRSDYITKDVLDTMVDEMLWEEDRPNAKALARKAEMVSSRARQKLNTNSAGSSDGFSRPGSSQSRALPLPRLQPPTGPLPPIPRPPPSLSSISERHPNDVETWRTRIEPSSRSVINGPPSVITSPTLANIKMMSASTTESLYDLDNEIAGSLASWQMSDQMTDINSESPITPITSPHVSVNYDFHKHISNEGRPRVLRTISNEYRGPPRAISTGLSHANTDWDTASTVAPASEHPSMFIKDAINMPLPSATERQAMRSDSRFDDVKTLRRATSQASSQQSSARSAASRHSVQADSRSIASSNSDQAPIPPKSSKRLGFSLFPTKSRQASPLSPLSPDNTRPTTARVDSSEDASMPRSMPPLNPGMMPETADRGSAPDYLSLNTALQWKMTHKKVKKASKLPPLPGADQLEHLHDRDHVFIIDDSASMTPVWADVKRLFEALSYIVKPMSPKGTELIFTVSYDAWQRRDTSELCSFLDKKTCAGETDISWRLGVQFSLYKNRFINEKKKELLGKKFEPVRPVSFYVLTNGEWRKEGGAVRKVLEDMVAWMKEISKPGWCTVEFVSFAQSAKAMGHFGDLAGLEFDMDVHDCTRWTGNVLKMLRGPLDKALYADDSNAGAGGPPATANGGGSQVSSGPSSVGSSVMFSHPNVGSSFELA